MLDQIVFDNTSLPVLNGCDLCAASEPFYHADRVLDFNVLIYVTDGVIYVTEEDKDYEIKSGELFFLHSGVHHFGKFETPKGTRWYFVHFYFEEKSSLPAFVRGNEPVEQYTEQKYSVKLPKKIDGIKGSEIEKKIIALNDYFHSDDDMKKWRLNVHLFDLLTEIAFYGSSRGRKPSLSDNIADYLSRHCCEKFSAAQLESEFFLTYKHMASVFRKEKGMTMQKYHTELRMKKAEKLLCSTFMTIGEISDSIGYTDMLYFSRCFHSYFGKSPTEYRKTASLKYY